MDEKEANQVREDRSKSYGDFALNMETAGLALTALIEQHYQMRLPYPVPAKVAALFMVNVKLLRQSFAHKDDNFVDAYNYLQIAEETSRPVDPAGPMEQDTMSFVGTATFEHAVTCDHKWTNEYADAEGAAVVCGQTCVKCGLMKST